MEYLDPSVIALVTGSTVFIGIAVLFLVAPLSRTPKVFAALSALLASLVLILVLYAEGARDELARWKLASGIIGLQTSRETKFKKVPAPLALDPPISQREAQLPTPLRLDGPAGLGAKSVRPPPPVTSAVDYVRDALTNQAQPQGNSINSFARQLHEKLSPVSQSLQQLRERVDKLESNLLIRTDDGPDQSQLDLIAQESRLTISNLKTEIERLYWIISVLAAGMFAMLGTAVFRAKG